MRWLLVWTSLVLGAAATLFVLGRRLWRSSRALFADLAAFTDQLGSLGHPPGRPAGPAEVAPPAESGDVRSTTQRSATAEVTIHAP